MSIVDLLSQGLQAPRSVFLWTAGSGVSSSAGHYNYDIKGGGRTDSLTFQYWPQSLQDDYQVEYTEHNIPGGSHPLYQWVGGRGRTISFQAIFTSEINEPREGVGGIASGQSVFGTVPLFTPSSPYTVDVRAALAILRSWMLPSYGDQGRLALTDPPPILKLAMPNTGLGGQFSEINVILRNAPITIESWFPDGTIRVATVDLTFNEIVQEPGGKGSGSTVTFISRSNFQQSVPEDFKINSLGNTGFFGVGGGL